MRTIKRAPKKGALFLCKALKIGAKYRFKHSKEKVIVTLFSLEECPENNKKYISVEYGLRSPHMCCSVESFIDNYTLVK